MSRISGTIFAETDGVNPVACNAKSNQHFADGQRPAFAQRAIVFLRTALVAMSCHANSRWALATMKSLGPRLKTY